MAYYEMEYGTMAAHAAASERASFIRRTYAHLAGAVLAFVAIEWALFSFVPQETIESFVRSVFASRFGYLIMFGAFLAVGYLAQWWAHAGTSRAVQYMGLMLYVTFQAIWFVPMLWLCVYKLDAPTILPTAAILTLCVFGGLTTAVLTTGRDFSFLRPILSIAGFLVLGVILAAVFFPDSLRLGLWFSLLMVGVACAYILYDTSNVLHHYRTDQDVGAALQLFASLALLFWYILQILMSRRE